MRYALVIIILVGVGLSLYSATIPAYADKVEKEKWDAAASDHIGKEDWEPFTSQYYAAVSKLRTPKYRIMDLGFGTASLGFSLLLACLVFKIATMKDIRNIASPKLWLIFAIANVAWLAMIPASFLYYIWRQQRGDYPWFADSIGIPIFTGTAVTIVGLPILNLVLALFIRRSQHPSPIFCRFPKYAIFPLLEELFICLLIVLTSFALFGLITDGDVVGVPICLALMYVFLSIRAGKANRIIGEAGRRD